MIAGAARSGAHVYGPRASSGRRCARVRLVDVADIERARPIMREVGRHANHYRRTTNSSLHRSRGRRDRSAHDGSAHARAQPPGRAAIDRSYSPPDRPGWHRRSLHFAPRRRPHRGASAGRYRSEQQLRSRIGQTAVMTFHMVREVSPEEAGRGPSAAWRRWWCSRIPVSANAPEVVERRPQFTGERLTSASPSDRPKRRSSCSPSSLDGEGSSIFCRITRDIP